MDRAEPDHNPGASTSSKDSPCLVSHSSYNSGVSRYSYNCYSCTTARIYQEPNPHQINYIFLHYLQIFTIFTNCKTNYLHKNSKKIQTETSIYFSSSEINRFFDQIKSKELLEIQQCQLHTYSYSSIQSSNTRFKRNYSIINQ